jgi:hypothetical protein
MKELPFTGFFNLYYGLLKNKIPVIVYQMAKVGSSSVCDSLKMYGIRPVFHVHRFNPPVNGYGRRIYKHIIKPNRKADFITLVRDPISRNISNFFGGVIRKKYSNSVNELIHMFPNFVHGNNPLTWFDVELKKILNIDIYSYPFPKEKGSLVIENGNFRLLVLKLELNDSNIEKAIIDFLCIDDDFKLIRTNVSRNKIIGDTYKEFKKKLILPQGYIDQMTNSKYFKHFYSKNEIKKIIDNYKT